jgi:hypothetical protein
VGRCVRVLKGGWKEESRSVQGAKGEGANVQKQKDRGCRDGAGGYPGTVDTKTFAADGVRLLSTQ